MNAYAWTREERTYITILARRANAINAGDDIRVLYYDTLLEFADSQWPMLGFNVGQKLARMKAQADAELARNTTKPNASTVLLPRRLRSHPGGRR